MKKDLFTYVSGLYVPVAMKEEHKELLNKIARGLVIPFIGDERGVCIPIIELKTAGNGDRKTFKGFERLYCDTGKMGKAVGLIAVRPRAVSNSVPVRFKYRAYRYLLIKGE
jgi:hypothetical protein